MSLPYFPMFPSDFEAKTSHLTLEEDGAYNRLLRIMWMTPGCSVPDNDAWIARRMRVDEATYERVVRVVIDEFCTREGGRVRNSKLTEIFHDSSERHEKRVSAGSKGGKAKALKTNDTGPSNAKAKPKQPEPEPEYKKEDLRSSQKNRGSRLPDDWVLPMEWGRWAVDEGWSEVAVRDEAARFADYWRSLSGQKATKRDWLATWRNWMRNSKKPKGGLNGTGSFNGNGANHTGRGSAHDSLLAGFGAFARGDGDGSGFDPDGGEATSHASDAGLDRWQDGYASQPVLRVIGS